MTGRINLRAVLADPTGVVKEIKRLREERRELRAMLREVLQQIKGDWQWYDLRDEIKYTLKK